jgi:hypothetical protein
MQENTENSKNTFSNLEDLVKLIPILTAAILAVSITFDSALLWALGLTLLDIPSSIAEHIRSALLWLPFFFAFLIFGCIEHAYSINRKKSMHPEKTDKFLMYKLYAGVIFAVTAFVIVSITDKTFQYAFIIFLLLWFVVIVKLIRSYENNQQRPTLFIRILYSLPVILAIFGYAGYFIGNRIYNQEKPKWEYTLKKDDKEIILIVNGQRRFTEFTIAIVAEKKILIIQNSNIVSMKSL